MKRRIRLLMFLSALNLSAFSQDPIFYNVNQSLVYLNPSFAGSNGFIRNQIAYRNQWPNLSGRYLASYNCLDAYIKPMRGGVGFTYLHDDQARGLIKTDIITLSYAQYFSFKNSKLKIIPSFQAAYFVKKLDVSRLTFGDQIDPRSGFSWTNEMPSSKKSNIDLSSGLLISYQGFYFGTSVFHMNQPDEGFLGVSKLPYRLSIHSSYNLKIGPRTLMNFCIRYDKQQKFNNLSLKANVLLMNNFIIGAGVSTNDVLNFNAGYRNNYFVLSAGYDAAFSKLSGNTAGSWDIQASFNLRTKENRKTIGDFETW